MKCFLRTIEKNIFDKPYILSAILCSLLASPYNAHAATLLTNGQLSTTANYNDLPDFNISEFFSISSDGNLDPLFNSKTNLDAALYSSLSAYHLSDIVGRIETLDVNFDAEFDTEVTILSSLDEIEEVALKANFGVGSDEKSPQETLEEFLGVKLTPEQFQQFLDNPDSMAHLKVLTDGLGKGESQGDNTGDFRNAHDSLQNIVGQVIGSSDYQLSINDSSHRELAQTIAAQLVDRSESGAGLLTGTNIDASQDASSSDGLFTSLDLKSKNQSSKNWQDAIRTEYLDESTGETQYASAQQSGGSSFYGSDGSDTLPRQIKVDNEPTFRSSGRRSASSGNDNSTGDNSHDKDSQSGGSSGSTPTPQSGGSEYGFKTDDRNPAGKTGSSDGSHTSPNSPSDKPEDFRAVGPGNGGDNGIAPLASNSSGKTATISDGSPVAAAPKSQPNPFQEQLDAFNKNYDAGARAAGSYPESGDPIEEQLYKDLKQAELDSYKKQLEAEEKARQARIARDETGAYQLKHGANGGQASNASSAPQGENSSTGVDVAQQVAQGPAVDPATTHPACANIKFDLIQPALKNLYNPQGCSGKKVCDNMKIVDGELVFPDSPLKKAVSAYQERNNLSEEEAKLAFFKQIAATPSVCEAFAKPSSSQEEIKNRNDAIESALSEEQILSIAADIELKESQRINKEKEVEIADAKEGHAPGSGEADDAPSPVVDYYAEAERVKNSNAAKDCVRDVVDHLYTVENFEKKIGDLGVYVSNQVGLINVGRVLSPSIDMGIEERVKTIKGGILPTLEKLLETHEDPQMFCRSKDHIVNLLKPDPTTDYLENLKKEDPKKFEEALKATAWFQGAGLAGLMDKMNIYDKKTGTCVESIEKFQAHEPDGYRNENFAKAILISNFANENTLNGLLASNGKYLNNYKETFRQNTYGMNAMNCLVSLSGVPLEKAKEGMKVGEDYKNLAFKQHILKDNTIPEGTRSPAHVETSAAQ